MFLDESAFDEDGPKKNNTLSLREFDDNGNDDGDDLPAFRSAGSLGTPSSSRARMLAQQRELQLKKRQTNMLSGGMVRSSLESSLGSPIATSNTNSPALGGKGEGSRQYTPAIRQFSAPKAVRDTSTDADDHYSSEFGAGTAPGSGYKPALGRHSRDDHSRPGSAHPPSRGGNGRISRYSDDEDEEAPMNTGRSSNTGPTAPSSAASSMRPQSGRYGASRGVAGGSGGGVGRHLDEDDEDEMLSYRGSGGATGGAGSRGGGTRGRGVGGGGRSYDPNEEDFEGAGGGGDNRRWGANPRDRDRDRNYEDDPPSNRGGGRPQSGYHGGSRPPRGGGRGGGYDDYDDDEEPYDERSGYRGGRGTGGGAGRRAAGGRGRSGDDYDDDRDYNDVRGGVGGRDRDPEYDDDDWDAGRRNKDGGWGGGSRTGGRRAGGDSRNRGRSGAGGRGFEQYSMPSQRGRGDRDNDGPDSDTPRSNAGARAHQAPAQQQAPPQAPVTQPIEPPELGDIRRFLTTPLKKANGIVQCYIRRNKSGTNKLFPIYSLYLKEGDVFLMASKKRPKNKTSNYHISMDQSDLTRTSSGYLGKLRSNFVGTEFQVFDNGVNPKDVDDEGATSNGADVGVRCELGVVMYAANVLGSRGPRKMQVAIPGLDDQNRIIGWKDQSGSASTAEPVDDMMSRMKERNLRDLHYLINKPPRWNEQVGAYVLNFNGRVTMASVKNFQLVNPDEQNAVVLQFGRVGKDEFTMDLQWPMSPFQAFAITLSSFDSKIACD